MKFSFASFKNKKNEDRRKELSISKLGREQIKMLARKGLSVPVAMF